MPIIQACIKVKVDEAHKCIYHASGDI